MLHRHATTLHVTIVQRKKGLRKGNQQDGTGLRVNDDVASPAGFAAWVKCLLDAETRADSAEQHPCAYRWIVHDEQYQGSILPRHKLTPALMHKGGHIGYGKTDN